jgi:hypothetical protein
LSRALLAAAAARLRCSLGTYTRLNSPMASPATQVQIHHLEPAGRLSRTISKTTSATAHPAEMTQATTLLLASSGGGGDLRSAGPRDGCTPQGYEEDGPRRHQPTGWPRVAALGRPA